MKIELTQDETMMTVYALKEMASRRYEQAIDRNQPALRKEADAHIELSYKFFSLAIKPLTQKPMPPQTQNEHKPT